MWNNSAGFHFLIEFHQGIKINLTKNLPAFLIMSMNTKKFDSMKNISSQKSFRSSIIEKRPLISPVSIELKGCVKKKETRNQVNALKMY